MSGPLAGTKVVEIAGIGPGPFAAMMLADLGAEVIRVDRPDAVATYDSARDASGVLRRSRRSVAVNLKQPAGVETVLRLASRADAVIEGFRPGVAERLGIGPEVAFERNPALIYGRMTGWGQSGPYAQMAGHDIDYIALTGILYHIGRAGQPPTPPLNLVADFGGGGMLLALGVVCALFEARESGQGQVVDAAMCDGAALLAAIFFNGPLIQGERGTNQLDGGAPFYDTYETADRQYVAVGAIEPPFYDLMLRLVGLDPTEHDQWDRSQWPSLKAKLATVFKTKTREEWCALMEGTDACFAPVLRRDEAPHHPHATSRRAFVDVDGEIQPAPAPRFSRTALAVPTRGPRPGQHTDEALTDWGFTRDELADLHAQGAIV
jgi:alpha-methylacyl-CoA racemase